jgi:RimJ/RimL family protein N-acetyltransferase
MRVALEPATPADFERLIGGRPCVRARALAARLDAEIIGIGGFLYLPDGTVWASMLVTPAGRRFPAAVYRAGVLAMRLARRLGLREVLASPDVNEPAAERFLERLGFVRVAEIVYRWRP